MTSAWGKADLHIHTSYSDGADDVPAILEHVATHTDMDVIAITDHDRIAGALEARRLAPDYGVEVVVGQEVTTYRGHVLALFIEKRIPAGRSIRETVRLIHAQGGLAVLAHPLDRLANSPVRRRPQPSILEWQAFGVDALEGRNGCRLDPLAEKRTEALGKQLNLARTGGSDAHSRQVIGVAHTLFPGHTAAELHRALWEGRVRSAGGRWNLAAYLRWAVHSFVPGTLQALRRPMPTPEMG